MLPSSYSQELMPLTAEPDEPIVQLRYATLPSLLRPIAVHHWFTAWRPEARRWERWEVWQRRAAGGEHWGHLHRDLMRPDRPVGGGPCVAEREWRGKEAEALLRVLGEPARYPYRDLYRYWPGPNSNTYAAWVLRVAEIPHVLDPRAVGKDYMGLCGVGRCPVSRSLRVETPLAGVRLGAGEGVELHLLCLTFGVQLRPLRLSTPLGSLQLTRSPKADSRRSGCPLDCSPASPLPFEHEPPY